MQGSVNPYLCSYATLQQISSICNTLLNFGIIGIHSMYRVVSDHVMLVILMVTASQIYPRRPKVKSCTFFDSDVEGHCVLDKAVFVR